IIAIDCPRCARIRSSGRLNISAPASSPGSHNRIDPLTSALAGNSRSIASDVADFPDPDSPTSPSVSPRPIANETPCTASWPENAIRRSLTSSRGFSAVCGDNAISARIADAHPAPLLAHSPPRAQGQRTARAHRPYSPVQLTAGKWRKNAGRVSWMVVGNKVQIGWSPLNRLLPLNYQKQRVAAVIPPQLKWALPMIMVRRRCQRNTSQLRNLIWRHSAAYVLKLVESRRHQNRAARQRELQHLPNLAPAPQDDHRMHDAEEFFRVDARSDQRHSQPFVRFRDGHACLQVPHSPSRI